MESAKKGFSTFDVDYLRLNFFLPNFRPGTQIPNLSAGPLVKSMQKDQAEVIIKNIHAVSESPKKDTGEGAGCPEGGGAGFLRVYNINRVFLFYPVRCLAVRMLYRASLSGLIFIESLQAIFYFKYK
jgi:hypothetical protein